MGVMILSFLSVLVFCFSARALIQSIRQPMTLARVGEFSKRAQRVERAYRIFAWAALTLFLFYSMALSFWSAFTETFN